MADPSAKQSRKKAAKAKKSPKLLSDFRQGAWVLLVPTKVGWAGGEGHSDSNSNSGSGSASESEEGSLPDNVDDRVLVGNLRYRYEHKPGDKGRRQDAAGEGGKAWAVAVYEFEQTVDIGLEWHLEKNMVLCPGYSATKVPDGHVLLQIEHSSISVLQTMIGSADHSYETLKSYFESWEHTDWCSGSRKHLLDKVSGTHALSLLAATQETDQHTCCSCRQQ
jgi:hypothetical protein